MTVPNHINLDFEQLKFDIASHNEILLDNLSDPDYNLFNENLQQLDYTTSTTL